MIEREMVPCLLRLFRQYPFVTVTGPRQSGKTTLCRSTFPGLGYANLEAPDQRDFAESDPRGFLAHLGEGAILDEVQHVPDLLSYLQVLADEKGRNGLYVLTGSEQFRFSDTVSQSLAGRTALLRLLPFSLAERRMTGAGEKVDDILYSGFYPRIFDQGLDPRQALGDYFENYVEREVRRIGGVRDLSTFRRFVRICAGRVGQLVNLSSLSSDVGVSRATVRGWLSILERSYILFQLEPYYVNIGKRLIKSPKLYFYDVGLASYLIGIRLVEQMSTHPLRGALFENAVVVEALKHRFNRGRRSNLSFFRDARGLECDLFYETGRGIWASEIKSGATVSSDFFRSLNRVGDLVPGVTRKVLVYGGFASQSRSECKVVPLSDFAGMLERFEAEQELATLAKERKTESDRSVVRNLDAAYYRHIWPLVKEIVSSCGPLLSPLFRGVRDTFSYVWRASHDSFQGWVQTGDWAVMRESLMEQGFDLAGRWRFELRFRYELNRYEGKTANDPFDLLIVATWEFDGEGFSRRVMVGGERIPELDRKVLYREVESKPPELDRAVAKIYASLSAQVRTLSTA